MLEFCQQELASAEGKLNEMRLSDVEEKLTEWAITHKALMLPRIMKEKRCVHLKEGHPSVF